MSYLYCAYILPQQPSIEFSLSMHLCPLHLPKSIQNRHSVTFSSDLESIRMETMTP